MVRKRPKFVPLTGRQWFWVGGVALASFVAAVALFAPLHGPDRPWFHSAAWVLLLVPAMLAILCAEEEAAYAAFIKKRLRERAERNRARRMMRQESERVERIVKWLREAEERPA